MLPPRRLTVQLLLLLLRCTARIQFIVFIETISISSGQIQMLQSQPHLTKSSRRDKLLVSVNFLVHGIICHGIDFFSFWVIQMLDHLARLRS